MKRNERGGFELWRGYVLYTSWRYKYIALFYEPKPWKDNWRMVWDIPYWPVKLPDEN